MKKIYSMSGIGAGTLFTLVSLSGCLGAGVSTGLEVGNTTVNNFGTGPAARQVDAAKPPAAPVSSKQIILLGDKVDLLRLNLVPEGISADEKTLSGTIAQGITSGISSNDARVMSGGNTDLRLTVRPKLTTIDQAGEYFRMNCDVVIELKAVNSDRIFGSRTIRMVGARKLGKEAAIAQFDEPAAKAAAEWCRGELKRIADNDLGVAVLTMQLPTVPKGDKRSPELDARNIKAIGDNLAKLPNLVSYEFVGQDQETGNCQFRVAYFKSAYPSGIANEVSALIRSIVSHK